VAALCHDLQHPGVTNSYLVNTVAPLAIRYNNIAVLENHHAAMTFIILSDPSTDITRSLKGDGSFKESSAFRLFRDNVTSLIMGTEVASHKHTLQKLKSICDEGFKKESSSHRRCFMTALLQCADLSNEARGFQFSRLWAPLVQQEFFLQGDREAKVGMPVKNSFDRVNCVLGAEQAQFISDLCLPLYEQVSRLIPKISQCISNQRNNLETWKAMS